MTKIHLGTDLPIMSDTDHASAAEVFVADAARTTWHDESLWFVRQKRDLAVAQVPEWEALRDRASAIKDRALDRLDELLDMLEARAKAHGVVVHRAHDAEAHNEIVRSILAKHNVQRMVKSKSMLTEECHLNPYLERHGIEVIDTDLGERIVQLAKEAPSHIVLPAIHYRKEEVGVLFHEHLHTPEGESDPTRLTEAARHHLRMHFEEAKVGMTGVNFAVAETGGWVVCTNEGNADLGAHLADVHIASMGLEKVIPTTEDLAVFLRLLARSATGQAITTYTSQFLRPRAGQEVHLILVDNGRRAHMQRPAYRNALKCIRCGACLNTCPIYRRSGGHAYGATIPGPIGSVLSPQQDPAAHASLPFASTLCGSCTDVCPVKIDLHDQLLAWRKDLVSGGHTARAKTVAMHMVGWVMRHPSLFRWGGWMARKGLSLLPTKLTHHPGLVWTMDRDWPKPAEKSFFEQYRARTADSPASPMMPPASATVSSAPASLGRPPFAETATTDKRQPTAPATNASAVTEVADDRADRFRASLLKAGGSTTDAPINHTEDVLRYVTGTSRQQEIESSRLHEGPLNIRFLAHPEPHDGQTPAVSAPPTHLDALCDILIVDAHLGVVENGAVWITPADADRAALFLAQHVIVRLRRSTLVETMHEGLDHVGATWPAFGVWMAGPSKTADVEQSLVIGAHGPRSFVVALLDA